MTEISFIIFGNPISKKRARYGRYGVYTEKSTVEYEKHIRHIARESMLGLEVVQNSVSIILEVYFNIPDSWSNTKKEAAKSGLIKHVTKPDIDNIGKTVLDALNKIVYKDDNQVNSLYIYKQYSDTPRIEVSVRWI